MAVPAAGVVVPAQLGFLAIFNPSLGNTDETLDDQIVYYASSSGPPHSNSRSNSQSRSRRRTRGRPTADISQDERNERLRQIGLAQGMASFSRGFAEGSALDGIDTDKSRVVTHELEPGWWILASIDLTKVPLPPRLQTKTGESQEERFEFSTKEMKPANLILRDLLRAHSIFLMHHDSSLSALFVRSRRSKFVAVLSRYWDLFLSTWSVMLHGNPIRGVFGGINLAACGELGIGVGEEERGSGEREVLEGLVGRIDGIVDLVVSKFGADDAESDANGIGKSELQHWLGTGREPGAEDGAIFLGTGALSRKSLRDLTHWMEDLYTWGEHAYGVIESPTSTRRAKARKDIKAAGPKPSANVPPNVVEPTTTARPEDKQQQKQNFENAAPNEEGDVEDGKLDKMVSYLKLGYGSYWSIPGVSGDSPAESAKQEPGARASKPQEAPKEKSPSLDGRPMSSQDAAGHYLIGLKGEIEEGQSELDMSVESEDADPDQNSRTFLRTLNVELESGDAIRPEETIVRDFEHPASVLTQSQVMGNMLPGYSSHDLNKAEKLRVVVYVNRPFIFTFLFRLRTDSLALDSLYRSLHYQLAPLRKPLLASTSYRPERPNAGPVASSIYDLVWDPPLLTIQSSIPNIPEELSSAEPQWSRADAVSTHLHLLNMHAATRPRATELERTQKTSRGWWIVFTRLMQRPGDESSRGLSTVPEASPTTSSKDGDGDEEAQPLIVGKEILLIRRASDHASRGSIMDAGSGSGDGVRRLAQGIGVDTRRYVEELLTLL